jgi:sugar phosphate permease
LRPWIVWCTGLLAYIVAVLDRSTFGVSALDAADRFAAGPSVLSSFVVLQLVIYAGAQIPTGVLLDRYGPKTMIVSGVAVMSAGQAILALIHSLPMAIGGYAVVGLGDAFVFISVIRLVPNWFPASRVPLLTQLTGICGYFGQVLSAVPFLALLLYTGWTVAYTSAAALGVLSIVLMLALVDDTPAGVRAVGEPMTVRQALADVRTVWSRPGTRLGFFTHMGTHFSITVFALMWGFPYLTAGQGLSRGVAGGLLTVSVVTFLGAGVLVGIFSGRQPDRRSTLALAMIGVIAAVWTVVLVLPFPAPAWLLVVLVMVISVGKPVSILAFDFARTFNPRASLGTAQGMVNTGGFLASLLVMQSMGIIIGAAGGYSFDSFRLAWVAQYVIWAVAAAGIVINGRKTRRCSPVSEDPARHGDAPRPADIPH